MSEQEYIEIPIETDPEVLSQEAFDWLETVFPEWVPNDANLETIMVEAMARMTAEARDVASAVPTDIFRYYGELVGITPQEATYATSTVTMTVIDNKGYTILAGTQLGIQVTGDEIVPFETLNDYVIPTGVATANNVPIQAVEIGSESSGLDAPVTLLDTLDYVLSIDLDTPTSGGVDEEDDDDYLDRLRLRLTLLTPRPILPQDFAVLARDIAGVERATAIDGYNPADQTSNNERMVSVAVVDADGEALNTTIKQQVDDYLESLREVNFIVHVIDPSYTTIDVTFNVKAIPGYTQAELETAAETAVANYLSPANWGVPQFPPSGDIPSQVATSPQDWVNVTTVRYLEVAQVLNSVIGVNYIITLTMRKGADALSTNDITLTGAAPLTRPGAINGTVTP